MSQDLDITEAENTSETTSESAENAASQGVEQSSAGSLFDGLPDQPQEELSQEELVQEDEPTEAEQNQEQAQLQDSPQDQQGGDKPSQGEMPFAIVQGQAVTEIPKDLYIPPEALEVILEAFEGPLDLLLYLIRRQNLDVLEVDVSEITSQYMAYVEVMDVMQFELAAEYLVMAAMLAEIKSRMLLPRSEEIEDDEEDPRAQLIRRLQEYERFKEAAEGIDELPRLGRDIHTGSAQAPDRNLTRPDPEVDLKEVLLALADVLRRADMFEHHQIEREKLSTRERMTQVLSTLRKDSFVPFVSLFKVEEGRLGVVVTFLAVMELIKESLVEIVQNETFGPIHVKARAGDEVEEAQA